MKVEQALLIGKMTGLQHIHMVISERITLLTAEENSEDLQAELLALQKIIEERILEIVKTIREAKEEKIDFNKTDGVSAPNGGQL